MSVFACVQLLRCILWSGTLPGVGILTSDLQKWLRNIPLSLSSVTVVRIEECDVILQMLHSEIIFLREPQSMTMLS